MNDTHGPGGDMGQEELDLYVDGLLDDERRAAFERKLFADPELAAELERQRSLDARLNAAFPVPEDPAAIAERALSGGRPRHAGGRWLSLLNVAVAASLVAALGLWQMGAFDAIDERPAAVVAVGGSSPGADGFTKDGFTKDGFTKDGFTKDGFTKDGFTKDGFTKDGFTKGGLAKGGLAKGGLVTHGPRSDGPATDGPVDLVPWVEVHGPEGADVEQACVAHGGLYAELADEWRQATVACGIPHDLERHFQDSLGYGLLVDRADDLPIEGPFTIRRWPTTTLLASPQLPEPILILVDELARDPRPVLEPDSPAHLFRRELGDLVLYELTPWDTPRALGLFRLR